MSPAFRKGGDVAEEAAKKASPNFARTQWFGIKDGETAILRFITEATDWITVDQHTQVPTKGKPDGHTGNWPERMGAICRNDPAFVEPTGKRMFPDCYICEFLVGKDKQVKKASPRTWALACLREQVIEDGKVVGIRDKIREVERKRPDSDQTEVVKEKDIVVVSQGWKNFWGALQGFAGHYGTITDRDYKITRKGSTTDTEYRIIPLDPIKDDRSNEKLAVTTPDGSFTEWGKRYDGVYDLAEIITDQASDRFYGLFFDPRIKVGKEGKVEETGAAPESKAQNDVDEERLKDLASRVRSYSTGGETPGEHANEATSGGIKNYD